MFDWRKLIKEKKRDRSLITATHNSCFSFCDHVSNIFLLKIVGPYDRLSKFVLVFGSFIDLRTKDLVIYFVKNLVLIAIFYY